MATDQELLQSGVSPEAIATLAADRPIFEARELDRIAPVISEAEALASTEKAALDTISVAISEEEALDSIAPKVSPLDIFSDDALIADKSFSPKEEYIRAGGAAAFDAKQAARLGKIRKGQEASRSVLGTVGAQLGNIVAGVPHVIKGVGEFIAGGVHAGIVNPLVQTSVFSGADPGMLAEYQKLSEQQAAEATAGAVAETAGLAKGVRSLGKFISRKTGLSKDWKDMSDEEAFRAIIDEGESEREVRAMAQGDIPALSPTFERLAAEGVPVRPEKIQEATERGGIGWLAFGAGLNLGGQAAKAVTRQAVGALPASVLSAAQKAEQLAALRTAKDAALKAQQAGPKNAATEAALKTAQENFQAAEAAVGESNLAGALDLANRARSALSSASTTAAQGVIGRPIQAAGAAAETVAKAVTSVPRWVTGLGGIGGLFVNPTAAIGGILSREVAAPLVQRAGAAVKGFGKSVAEGEARRTLDVLGAVKDTAAGGLRNYPMDYAFSVGLSDTEQEARASPPIGTALGVIPGAGRGVRRIVTGELVTPRGTPTLKPSPAYGENKILDTAHATAMKTVDSKTSAQINWVRNLAKKMGGRVYLMPDTATFESTLREVWKQQNPGVEVTPAMEAQFKQAADQQGFAWGEFTAADGERQPTVFIKNPEAVIHEMGHIMEKVLPESVNARLDEQILNRLSPENLEAAGTYYAKRLGRSEPWREVLSQLNPELSAEQYLARELRAENMGVALQNRGEAFATSPGMYRWLVQQVARIGDAQGIPLAQSEALGFPIFADVMAKGEKAAGKVLADEAGQALIEARETRLRTPTAVSGAAKGGKAPVTPVTEAAKGEALAAELAVRDPAQAEVLRKISSAIATGQALKIDYRSAPGEPAGSLNMSREARRTVIEAFRDMPESARPLWEKTAVPFRLEPTKNKGVQILTWSPEVLAANAHKMAKFIADAQLQRLSPYEVDPATKSFTADAWQKLYDDVQTFTKNQQAGGTGAGVPLKLPANAAEMNISVPALNEAALVPLSQATADFINIIFHLPPPKTARVSRKGGTPGNIVAQEIARVNDPARIVEPAKASAEEFKGFPGRTIKELNPLRAEMERAVDTKSASNAFKTSFPSLIETNQRLNLEHLADANPVPEVAAIRPVTETLRAGFLPAVLPEAFALAKQHSIPELERLGTEAKAQSAKARADYESTKANLAPMDRLDALSALQPLALKAQAFEEALLVKQSEAPTETSAQFLPKEISPAELTDKISSEEGYVYHATNRERLQEIAEAKKLNPHKPSFGTDQNAWPDGGTEKRSYFSNKAGTVWMFAPEEGMPVVVRAKESSDFKTESTGDKYRKTPIVSSELEYLAKDGNWYPVTQLDK